MKKQGFIKNKVMAQLVVASVDKVGWIPHTNVIPPTFEGDDGDDVWWVQSQYHPSIASRFMPFSSIMQIAYVNGHCEATFTSIKLLFY
jgi:hypothetical protein